MVQRRQPIEWVAALFLAGGAALLVFIFSGISLRWTFLAMGLGAAGILTFALRRMELVRRRKVLRRIVIGAVTGLVATVAYDLVRLGLVEFAGLKINPIEAWRLFGVSLMQSDTADHSAIVMVAGTAFHVCNGIAFGIAYTIAFGTRGPWAGILWAFVLEGFMVSVYPGWLGLKALDEFLSVSITGHIAYGIVLGVMARALINRGDHDLNPSTTSGQSADAVH